MRNGGDAGVRGGAGGIAPRERGGGGGIAPGERGVGVGRWSAYDPCGTCCVSGKGTRVWIGFGLSLPLTLRKQTVSTDIA